MDDELRRKFAPRRNKRHADLGGFNDEAAWANTLDWSANDHDFHRLTSRILDSLDSTYREKWGVRIDQLAGREEIRGYFCKCRAAYLEEPVFQTGGIYVFLHLTMDLWLGGRAKEVLDRRRDDAVRTYEGRGI